MSWLAEESLGSQEGLFSMELVMSMCKKNVEFCHNEKFQYVIAG